MFLLKRNQRQYVMSYLRRDPEARALVARMARSEVKNYLAAIAEEAERPFADPVTFLRDMARDAVASGFIPMDPEEFSRLKNLDSWLKSEKRATE